MKEKNFLARDDNILLAIYCDHEVVKVYVFYSLPIGVCFFHILFPPFAELRRRYEGKELLCNREQ